MHHFFLDSPITTVPGTPNTVRGLAAGPAFTGAPSPLVVPGHLQPAGRGVHTPRTNASWGSGSALNAHAAGGRSTPAGGDIDILDMIDGKCMPAL